MRADRLLSIVLLLQAHQQLTSRTLAERLEVSERTIHRDMEALSGAGIPVVAERGSSGGWSLLGQYRTNLTGLNESEIQSLFVTAPAMYRRGAERAKQRIYVDSTGWARTEESVPLLPVLQDAIWTERKVRITYERGAECAAVEREVDPLGLVAKGSAWYLVGGVSGELRSYRVTRIVRAETLETASQIPPGFDLQNFWRQSTATFKASLPKYTATFRVAPSVFPRLSFAGRFARVGEVIETDSAGWFKVSVGFDVEEMACEYALGFGPNLEVIEPETLRRKVVEMAREVVTVYAEELRS